MDIIFKSMDYNMIIPVSDLFSNFNAVNVFVQPAPGTRRPPVNACTRNDIAAVKYS